MKRVIVFCFFLLLSPAAFSAHITGGEMIYTVVGPGTIPGSKVYQITLRLYRDNFCPPPCAGMPASVAIGVFNNDNGQQFQNYFNVPKTSESPIGVVAQPPCLSNPPVFNYSGGYYTFQVQLPINGNGWTVTYQTCCRVSGIANCFDSEGSTYTTSIPGNNTLNPALFDNSPRFQEGISIICFNKPFILDFSATDSDGDSLVYALTNAYNGGAAVDASFAAPAPGPYQPINYKPGFSGSAPLGPGPTINSQTGIISGIAPGAGKYVVAVVIAVYRNGVFITTHRKDFIVTVAPCDFADADLKTEYVTCDGLNFTFQNRSPSLLNLTFDWDFGDPASGAANTSTDEFPTHTFTGPGDYTVRLIVNRGTPCADTAFTTLRAWPGFNPAFAPFSPRCVNLPVQFNDQTTTAHGSVNYWRWDFGVTTATNDTSLLQNPTFTYSTPGNYNVMFIVATDKGCRDTLFGTQEIVLEPNFIIPRDTLICIVDTIQLTTNVSTGTITWSPNYMISNVNSFNPLVSPDVTTTYTAFYQDPFGCTATRTITVSVTGEVTFSGLKDTTICRTDSARINYNSNALYYSWTPANVFSNPLVKNPTFIGSDPSTLISVNAAISAKCFKDTSITVRTVPYPVALATGDERICFGRNAQLHASGGSSYLWSPSAYLNSITSPDPIAIAPKVNVTYIVEVRDTLGCPKPTYDTIKVSVIRLFANAGPRDTSVVLGQPVQLTGTGGDFYTWTPSTYLDNPNIATPVSLPQNDISYALLTTNDIGCQSRDTINIHVYFLPAGLYVPNAFTPSGDLNNDIFRPLALGIRTLEYFRVFNRWGVLLYQTSRMGDGWDGTYKGKPQDPAAYVYEAKAIDYQGKSIFKKGSFILIR